MSVPNCQQTNIFWRKRFKIKILAHVEYKLAQNLKSQKNFQKFMKLANLNSLEDDNFLRRQDDKKQFLQKV